MNLPVAEAKKVDWAIFDEKARNILKRLEKKLLPKHKGQIVAIDVDSGDYFLGASSTEALNKAKRKHPDKIFFIARVGGGGVIKFHSRRSL